MIRHDPDYIFDVTRVGQRMYNACNKEVWLGVTPVGIIGGAISGMVSIVNIVENGLNEAGSIAGGITLIIAGLIVRGFVYSSTSRRDDLKELSNAYLSMSKSDRKKYRKQMRAVHTEARTTEDPLYNYYRWKMPYDEMIELFEMKAVHNPEPSNESNVIHEDLAVAKEIQREIEKRNRIAAQLRREVEERIENLGYAGEEEWRGL